MSHKSALSLIRLHGILLINPGEATSSLLTREVRGPATVGGQLSRYLTNDGSTPIRLGLISHLPTRTSHSLVFMPLNESLLLVFHEGIYRKQYIDFIVVVFIT